MKPIKLTVFLGILVALLLFGGCAEDKDPDVANSAYLGSLACSVCHGSIYNEFIEHGHNFKLNAVSGATPTYPSFTPGVPSPPTGYTWADISYVIGGYGWKARFIDNKGYIITGASVQYNLGDSTWSAYKDGQTNVQYDCGSCHTTGWSTSGNQGGLAGIAGTFALAGVQCERCHGAGSAHVDTVNKQYITKNSTAAACGQCHYRTTQDSKILASGGFIKHREQYNEFLASPHKTALTCVTCHDPHRTIKYDAQTTYTSLNNQCTDCHGITSYHKDTTVTCVQCHMPKIVKSAIETQATTGNAPALGDIRSHLMLMNSTAAAGTQFFVDTNDGNTYSNLYLTLEYVCLPCHTGKDVTWANANAAGIHTAP